MVLEIAIAVALGIGLANNVRAVARFFLAIACWVATFFALAFSLAGVMSIFRITTSDASVAPRLCALALVSGAIVVAGFRATAKIRRGREAEIADQPALEH